MSKVEYAPHLIFTGHDGKQMLYTKTAYGPATITKHETTATDGKGRKIGFMVIRRTIEYTAPPEGERVYTLLSFERGYGLFHTVEVQMTKNGKPFGASQRTEIFNTEAEAEAHTVKTLEARKRKYEGA